MIWVEDITGDLNQDRFTFAGNDSSVMMNELNAPSLNGGIPRGGADEPARGGGVMGGRIDGSKQEADASPVLGGQLQSTRFDAR